jgi:hypothetical protein
MNSIVHDSHPLLRIASRISTRVLPNTAPHSHRGWLHITSALTAALPQMRCAKRFEDRVCRLVKR